MGSPGVPHRVYASGTSEAEVGMGWGCPGALCMGGALVEQLESKWALAHGPRVLYTVGSLVRSSGAKVAVC